MAWEMLSCWILWEVWGFSVVDTAGSFSEVVEFVVFMILQVLAPLEQ